MMSDAVTDDGVPPLGKLALFGTGLEIAIQIEWLDWSVVVGNCNWPKDFPK